MRNNLRPPTFRAATTAPLAFQSNIIFLRNKAHQQNVKVEIKDNSVVKNNFSLIIPELFNLSKGNPWYREIPSS